jgi:hypothetical protein
LPDRLKSAYPGQILDADAHAVGEALQAGMVGYAISRADLVIVPTQGSLLDATEAANAIRLVRNQEKASGRTIPTAVLFTRTSAALSAVFASSRRSTSAGDVIVVAPSFTFRTDLQRVQIPAKRASGRLNAPL